MHLENGELDSQMEGRISFISPLNLVFLKNFCAFMFIFLQVLSCFASAPLKVRLVVPFQETKVKDSAYKMVSWAKEEFPVEVIQVGAEYETYINLEGQFIAPMADQPLADESEWSLFIDDTPVELIPGKSFYFRKKVTNAASVLVVNAINGFGEVRSFKVGLVSEGLLKKVETQGVAQAVVAAATTVAPIKRFLVSGGASSTSIYYSETGLPAQSERAVTLRANVGYLLFPPQWDLALSVFKTATVLSKSEPLLDSIGFTGVNMRVGYALPWLSEPYRVAIQGGGYFTTTHVPNDFYGYKDIAGPQIYPTIRRRWTNGLTLAAYVKFSPVAEGIQFLDLSNHELAGGMSFAFPITQSLSLALTCDYSKLEVNFSGFNISSTTSNFGMSLLF